MNVELANKTIDISQFPGLKFEADEQGEDCVWIIDKYGNGYDINSLKKDVEYVYDGQLEGDFWRSGRGRSIERDENSIYE